MGYEDKLDWKISRKMWGILIKKKKVIVLIEN